MIDRTTHPFIVNTLESHTRWDLVIFPLRKPSKGWRACLVFDCTELDRWEDSIDGLGETAAEALDRLEGVLSGRGAELAGREYVAKPDPDDAERNILAKEDAERAAYLERWRNAPEWALWLAQDPDGRCDFFESRPEQEELFNIWVATEDFDYHPEDRFAGNNLLGSVRCEYRPNL